MTLQDFAVMHKAAKLDEEADHYLSIYEQYFRARREKVKLLMEIGVQNGGSVKMWRDYFPKAKIHGIDIDKKCKKHAEHRIKIFIGDQEDSTFLQSFADEYDIIIDDGGHTMKQQRRSFKWLFPKVKPGGFYVLEDLHTSYWPQFGGKLGGSKTAIAMLQGFVDDLHHRWTRHRRAEGHRIDTEPTYQEKHIAFVHFYDSICFVGKR